MSEMDNNFSFFPSKSSFSLKIMKKRNTQLIRRKLTIEMTAYQLYLPPFFNNKNKNIVWTFHTIRKTEKTKFWIFFSFCVNCLKYSHKNLERSAVHLKPIFQTSCLQKFEKFLEKKRNQLSKNVFS